MNQPSGHRRLRLAPDPSEAAPMTPVQAAHQQGVLETLAEQVDIRKQALAGINRLESMGIEELEILIAIAKGVIASKLPGRPALRLAANGGELVTA